MVETINALTIPCCSSEWWPALTEVLTILSTLLTFIKATADTARGPLMPSKSQVENAPSGRKISLGWKAPSGRKRSLGWKRLPQEIATPPIGPVTIVSIMRYMRLFGKFTDRRERYHVQATIFSYFSKLKNNKKTEIQPVKNPHKHPNYFYTLFNFSNINSM